MVTCVFQFHAREPKHMSNNFKYLFLSLVLAFSGGAGADVASFVEFTVDGQTYMLESEIGKRIYDTLDENDKKILSALAKQCQSMGAETFETCTGLGLSGSAILRKAESNSSRISSEKNISNSESKIPISKQTDSIENGTDSTSGVSYPEYVGKPPKLENLSQMFQLHLLYADMLNQMCGDQMKMPAKVLEDYTKRFGRFGLRDLLFDLREDGIYQKTKLYADEQALQAKAGGTTLCAQAANSYDTFMQGVIKRTDQQGLIKDFVMNDQRYLPMGVLPLQKVLTELQQVVLEDTKKRFEEYAEFKFVLDEDTTALIKHDVKGKPTFWLVEQQQFTEYKKLPHTRYAEVNSSYSDELVVLHESEFEKCINSRGDECEPLLEIRQNFKVKLSAAFDSDVKRRQAEQKEKARLDEQAKETAAIARITSTISNVYLPAQILQENCVDVTDVESIKAEGTKWIDAKLKNMRQILAPEYFDVTSLISNEEFKDQAWAMATKESEMLIGMLSIGIANKPGSQVPICREYEQMLTKVYRLYEVLEKTAGKERATKRNM